MSREAPGKVEEELAKGEAWLSRETKGCRCGKSQDV